MARSSDRQPDLDRKPDSPGGGGGRGSPLGTGTRGDSGRPRLGTILARWDDPLTWSVTLFSWQGYRIGVHWIVAFWMIAEGLLAILPDRIGPMHIAMGVLGVVFATLLREMTRLWICRKVGGEAEYVPLWPLGSLLGPTLPRGLTPRLLVVLTPTAVSIMLGVTLAGALVVQGAGSELLRFNPFDPRTPARSLGGSFWLTATWWAYYANFAVAGLNLLPLTPLDGGRLIEAFWGSGRHGSRRTVGLVGLLVAGVLLVAGLVAEQPTFIVISLFGGLASWLELRRAEFVDPYHSRGEFAPPPDWLVIPEDSAGAALPLDDMIAPEDEVDELDDNPSLVRRHEGLLSSPLVKADGPAGGDSQGDPGHDLDRVLAKISASGMGSLTDEERQLLQHATRRLQGE
ncbi:MAG: metalloprotease [Planctomycetota bacterium]